MATQFPGDQTAGMIDRIKRLLIAPAQEWPRIDAEPMTVRSVTVYSSTLGPDGPTYDVLSRADLRG